MPFDHTRLIHSLYLIYGLLDELTDDDINGSVIVISKQDLREIIKEAGNAIEAAEDLSYLRTL